MRIKVIDPEKFEERQAIWGYSESFETTYEVILVLRYHKKKYYLVDYESRLFLWNADLLQVIEETVPADWIEVEYSYFHKLKNDMYDFYFPINYYLGPKRFLENKNFLFDIYENPDRAYWFYKKNPFRSRFDDIQSVEIVELGEFKQETGSFAEKVLDTPDNPKALIEELLALDDYKYRENPQDLKQGDLVYKITYKEGDSSFILFYSSKL